MAADAALLERFYRGIYWDAFAAQHEPLETWQAALAGELPYRFFCDVFVANTGSLLAGITYELYPESRVGLLTYAVVRPTARGAGVGRSLIDGAIARLVDAGARAVFGEVNDPAVHDEPESRERLDRFTRWGARIVDARYVQPSLGAGLPRDRRLLLVAFHPPGDRMSGAIVRDFVTELYAVTEGGAIDDEIAIPDEVLLLADR